MLFFPEAKGEIFPHHFAFLPRFVSIPLSIYAYYILSVITQCPRITVQDSTENQYKAMPFAWLSSFQFP